MALLRLVDEYRELVVSALCGALTFGGLKLVEDMSGWHFGVPTHLACEFPIALLAFIALRHRERSHSTLAKLTQETADLHNTMRDVLTNALHSERSAANFHAIQSGHQYDAATSEIIRDLAAAHDGASLLGVIEKTSERMRKCVAEDRQWRVILERMSGSWNASITRNKYTLSLETYCNIIIDTIKVGLLKAKAQKLVVLSFTNVTPKDWFFEREVIGNPLLGYAQKIKEVVRSMKDGGHCFHRFVVCKDDGIAAEPSSLLGFPALREVKTDWANCNRNERQVYLRDYHTAGERAEVLSLGLPGLKLYQNCTEFVFFGFVEKDDPAMAAETATWWWCFCAGYTRNNVNVSASFINLSSRSADDQPRIPLLINIPNTTGLSFDTTTQILPQRIQVQFDKFPGFLLGLPERYSKRYRFESMLTLAMKWHLASEIWHSRSEESLLLQLVKTEVPNHDSRILDCACGTGFHALILRANGYNVTASDNDPENLRIFDLVTQQRSLTVDVSRADWKNLASDLQGRTFDILLCLGSSLPYYKTWEEDISETPFDENELRHVLMNFKSCLNPRGKLIIGLSRHINRNYSEVHLKFVPVPISKSLSQARDGEYTMKWEFRYDWVERRREWHCDIRNQHGDDYSFDLVSHLFDIHQLSEHCKAVFGPAYVRIEDPDIENYDMYVVCEVL